MLVWARRITGRLFGAAKISLLLLGALIAAIGFLYVFAESVAALRSSFTGTLAVVGLWAAFGAVLGQNKKPETGLKDYINAKHQAGIAVCSLLLLMVFLFLVPLGPTPIVEGWAAVGLLILTVVGFILGFMAGMDRRQKPSDP